MPRLWSSFAGFAALAFAFSATSAAPRALAQDWAKANLNKSPRHGEYVTIHEPGGRNLQAWVVYPESKGKAPVVLLIHEIFGLSDWAREMADEVAAAGYIVVEPDLLSGYGPTNGAAASEPPRAPPWTTCMERMELTERWRRPDPEPRSVRQRPAAQPPSPTRVRW